MKTIAKLSLPKRQPKSRTHYLYKQQRTGHFGGLYYMF